jgi:uncharacterized protein (TIGR02265 family)
MGADQKLIFKPVMEALFIQGVSDRATPAYRARLVKLGINVDKLLPGYDYAVFEAGIIESVTLFPELSREKALHELGRRMVNANIDANPVGKSLMPVLKLLGLSRALKRSLVRRGNENFNKVTFGAETPNSLEVLMSFVGMVPEFAQGTLHGLATALGGRSVVSHLVKSEGNAATYRLEWGA